jgi:cobyrinic acid a,c-diamide synthase
VVLARDSVIGPQGTRVRGHEFHYSEIIENRPDVQTDYRVTPRTGTQPISEGYRVHRTLGSYVHLHFGSNPQAARGFVENCRAYRQERTT